MAVRGFPCDAGDTTLPLQMYCPACDVLRGLNVMTEVMGDDGVTLPLGYVQVAVGVLTRPGSVEMVQVRV